MAVWAKGGAVATTLAGEARNATWANVGGTVRTTTAASERVAAGFESLVVLGVMQ